MVTLSGAGLKVAIVASSFNDFITKKLHEGALEALREAGTKDEDIQTFWVPGSFEIPLALSEVAEGEFDAAVCLGVVIKGETPHFNYVSGEAARGISEISVKKQFPVGFGVITANTTDQAIDRAGGKRGNKGREAALAAIEMTSVVKKIRADR